MKQQGFSLMELLVVMAIIMTVSQAAGHGIGATKYWLEPKRIFSAIQEIRSLAIINRQPAVLCPSSDSYQCIKNWQLPLIMFIDRNGNKQRDINENILQTIIPFTGLERSIEYPRTQIRFDEQGRINGYTGTLIYCSKYNTKSIVLSRVGRIRYGLNLDTSTLAGSNSPNPIICSNNL